MGLFSNKNKETDFTIERQFVTTLPSIKGYEIVEQRGLCYQYGITYDLDSCLDKLLKKVYETGCNAFVNLKIEKNRRENGSCFAVSSFLVCNSIHHALQSDLNDRAI